MLLVSFSMIIVTFIICHSVDFLKVQFILNFTISNVPEDGLKCQPKASHETLLAVFKKKHEITVTLARYFASLR